MPDVVGRTIEAGAAELQALKLCVWVEQGTGVDRGPFIVDQRPQPGIVVIEGTAVTVVTTSVQNLSGMLTPIGEGNRALSCTEGTGVPVEEDGNGVATGATG